MPTQTQIKSISVENVKGLSSAKFEFDKPEMLGNKFHILVAPNGFGKSSLASAFSSLKPRSLKLTPSLLHKENETNRARLEINYLIDNVEATVVADEERNDISKVFSISVINSRLRPRAASKSGFNPSLKPTASLIIDPITLLESVPNRPTKSFSTTEFRQKFGEAGKILPNIQPFLENDILLKRILQIPNIKYFGQKTVWKKIIPIVNSINEQTGTIAQIVSWIVDNKIAELRAVPELASIAVILEECTGISEVDSFLVAYQFAKAYEEDAKLLNDHRVWRSYFRRKQKCDALLKSVNSNPAWINVSIKETKGNLVAEFPEATRMSNGQRDLLSFVAQLMKAEFELAGARAILIVDEVFDYLDECNLLVAQFYASNFIEQFKSTGAEIFPLFLTHLNPDVFKHSVLGLGRKDIRKVHLLDKASDSSRRLGIAAMVKERENVALKPYIGKYFFHYHPDNCNKVTLFRTNALKETWGMSHDFYTYVFAEFKKYCSGDSEVDYVAACVAMRIAIEKHAFDQLQAADQTRFTDEFDDGTPEKLDFVEQRGGKFPESHRLLGLLYNDMLHHKEHFDYISAIVSKMKNPAIRGMIKEIPIPKSF